jgi:hypothetical protein
MKKIFFILILVLASKLCIADQLAYITKEQAEKTVQFIKDYGISKLILWCACCENDIPLKVEINKVFYRYTGYEEYYEIVVEGRKENGDYFASTVDLAYVHIQSGSKANCLGKELGFECTPCTIPFLWPK